MQSSYVRNLDPTVNSLSAKIENIAIEKISACITHPMSLISCRVWVFSSCTGWANYCSCVSMARLDFMECWAVPVCWLGVVWCGPMRGRWWALQKGNRLFQMAGLWWSAQLPQTWSSYSISPARQPVITLSLPLCYAIPDPPAVSGLISRSLSLCLIPSLSLLAKPIFLYSVLSSFPHSSARNTMVYFATMTMYSYTKSYIWIMSHSKLNLILNKFLNI